VLPANYHQVNTVSLPSWSGVTGYELTSDSSAYQWVAFSSIVYSDSPPAFNNDTLDGGSGIDTLNIRVAATLHDGSFANVSGFEVLSLTGSSSAYLGSLAAAAGITSIFGGSGNNTITLGSGDTLGLTVSDAGGDIINVGSPVSLSADSRFLSSGAADTLIVDGTSLSGAQSIDIFAAANTRSEVIRGDNAVIIVSGYNAENHSNITAGANSTLSFTGEYSGLAGGDRTITTGMNSSLSFSAPGAGLGVNLEVGDNSTLSFSNGAGSYDYSVQLGNDVLIFGAINLLRLNSLDKGNRFSNA
jgi:hypothetical protein